jgi:hypothetical protein
MRDSQFVNAAEVFEHLNNWALNSFVPVPDAALTRLSNFPHLRTEGGDPLIRRCASCGNNFTMPILGNFSRTHGGSVCEECAEDLVWTHDTGVLMSPEQATPAYTYWSSVYSTFTDIEYFEGIGELSALHPDADFPDRDSSVDYVTLTAFQLSSWVWREDREGSGAHPYDYDYDDGEDYSTSRYGVYVYGHHPYRDDYEYFEEPDEASPTNIPIGMELESRDAA